MVRNSVVSKTVVEKFTFSYLLKTEKLKFFTQNSTKIFSVAFLTLEVA